jgi:hypothetical protein
MGLSRLDNFLKSVRGTILYVDPSSLDSTDNIENQGNSLTRPFKTIQRALIESARFSYQIGLDNDRFDKTTILVYPGEHVIDNRPGWIPDGANNYRLRSGATSNDFPPFDLTTIFDITSPDNQLYKLNSIHGGVIIPRGTSLVGLDLRKTKIRPKYVPDPTNDNIERSCIFRVTGTCYFWQFSIFDADPNGQCYVDYTNNLFVPNFSHHKLSCFEYADGVNDVSINDTFQTYSTDRTDLEMYYEKVGLAYGQASGRQIQPDYPSSSLDIQPKIGEYRIVGPTGGSVGITSIRAGDGITPTTIITVTLDSISSISGLDVDTAFRINNISDDDYNGEFVVTGTPATNQITYQVQNAPVNALPSVTGARLFLKTDTVSSASPYIFNVSLRSVFGMCGVLSDGDKATGFKSMVIAQFTGIGLQKDDNAFVLYNQSTGQYEDSSVPGNENLSINSRAVYKPEYENFHIRTINDAYIQNVSIFAIGFNSHFNTESGGDQSINNSNSNFGAKSLLASGFKRNAFPRDDVGYITHVIPPREIESLEGTIEFIGIDVAKTIGVASTGHLYLYNETNASVPPQNVLQGYRIGAKTDDTLNILISNSGSSQEYSANIVMPDTQGTANETIAIKSFQVAQSVAGINSITSNVFTFTQSHTFINGESVRIKSFTGNLPDGIISNIIYYAITSGSGITSTTQIKLAKTPNDAINDSPITVNNKGGILIVESRVIDKLPGNFGHPIQYDTSQNNWYINVSAASTQNTIYSTIVSLGTTALGESTPRSYIYRKVDSRSVLDTIYRLRYVIPASAGVTSARPPLDGFIIQESSTTIGASDSEVAAAFSPTTVSLSNENQLRNFRIISNASWDGTYAYFDTELPHDLSIGSQVSVLNVVSSANTAGTKNYGFNFEYSVVGISSLKQFTVGLTTNPGTFTNNVSTRTTSLPRFVRKQYKETLVIYRAQEIEPYIPGEQDGVYHLLVVNASNSPSVAPFTESRFSQPIQNLYPQLNRDNPVSDPKAAASFALSNPIGQVVIDDPQNSITKESLSKGIIDFGVGVGLTNIVSSSTGIAHTFFTTTDHGFNPITTVGITSTGIAYGEGSGGVENLYNARLVGFAGSITGANATARITVNASGSITEIKIIDGGSAYGIGNTLAVVGVATTSGFVQGYVTVTGVYSHIGESLTVAGVIPATLNDYNNVYKITGIATGNIKQIEVESASAVGNASTTGIGVTATTYSRVINAGKSINVTTFTYNHTTGISTITTTQSHGLSVGNKITIGGATASLFNSDFLVKKVNSLVEFESFVGIATTSQVTTGTKTIYIKAFGSQGGTVTSKDENIAGRLEPQYAGITTTLSSAINTATVDNFNITNITNLDLNIGDYLLIDSEIMRIKQTVTGNPVLVFRGIYGTNASTHINGSVVRRIRLRPIELRRNSIIRASGHTFEYVGFGPGNYSTAFPDRQDRVLTDQEELLSQSTKENGGLVVFTGMNDRGAFYVGNKKVNSATGQEQVFDSPIPTVTGEDILSGISVGFDALTPLEISVSRSIRVEGGIDGTLISEFDGPVIFNKKITSNAPDGIEANSIFLQGNASVSRKYTVGVTQPAVSGNPGDIAYYSDPNRGGYVGWIYTLENDWYRFGNISLSETENHMIFDRVGIATTSAGTDTFRIGAGSSLFSVNATGGIGIGTTANQYKLNVNGNTNIGGTVTASYFSGDGSLLSNINIYAAGWTNITGGIYNTNLNNVGIGTSVPRFNLELGAIGTSSTSLHVNGTSTFIGFVTTGNVFVGGALTTRSVYEINNISSGVIRASSIGIGTTNPITSLQVGTASSLGVPTNGQIFVVTGIGSVGIGTTIPRAHLDIEGHTRFKSYSEVVGVVTSSSGIAVIDLSKAQTFTLTPTEAISFFRLLNPPTESTSFTLKILQGATAYSVGINTFKNNASVAIPVYWPTGGVLPIVTLTANATDIYSFNIFNGSTITSTGIYGVVVGQNFA